MERLISSDGMACFNERTPGGLYWCGDILEDIVYQSARLKRDDCRMWLARATESCTENRPSRESEILWWVRSITLLDSLILCAMAVKPLLSSFIRAGKNGEPRLSS